MEIHNFYMSLPGKSEVASFDVYIPALQMTLKKLRLFKTKTGYYRIGYPSYCVENPVGDKTWIPYFEFSEEKGKEFQQKVMQELQVFIPEISKTRR